MSRIRGLWVRVRANARPHEAERELDEEFRFHLDMETERLIREGADPAEARRRALIAFGGVMQHREAMRAGRGFPWIEGLWRDVRVAARGLRRSPALVVGAVLSLGLGIGLNTAMFSFVNAALFKPLSVPAGERLVYLQIARGERLDVGVSYSGYLDYRDRLRTVEALATQDPRPATVRVGDAAPERKQVALVSGNYFRVLGLQPALGRFFLPEEDRTAGTHAVAVVSHYFWQHEMRGDPDVLGRTLTLNRRPFMIVGVAPAAFGSTMPPAAYDIFVPAMMRAAVSESGRAMPLGRGAFWGTLVGRLRPGADVAQANAEFGALTARLAANDSAASASTKGVVIAARGFTPELQRMAGHFLLVLSLAVAVALVVACANVAGLLLARGAARRREFAIRLSLGARRSAVIRALLVESLLLAVPGGLLGLLLALRGAQALSAFLAVPGTMRIALDLTPDGHVLAFTLVVTVGCALLFGLLPALQTTRPDLMQSLRGEAATGARGGMLGGAVVVAQVALAGALLCAASVPVRDVIRTLHVDPGLRVQGVAQLDVDPSGPAYSDPSRQAAFKTELVRRLAGRPEIEAVGLTSAAPLGPNEPDVAVRLPGQMPATPGAELHVPYAAVTPGVLELLGVRLLRGRTITDADREGAPAVAVITAKLAAHFWPAGDAVGRQLRVEDGDVQVIGVVEDARYAGLEAASPYLFLSYPQSTSLAWHTSVLVRARASDARAIIPVLRDVVRAIDPEVPVERVAPITANRDVLVRPLRVMGTLVGLCAALAMVLAAIGTYALLAYTVVRRTREIGVRVALGARGADVSRLIVRQGVTLVVLGLAFGLPAGLLGIRALHSILPDVRQADPISFAGVAALLIVLGVLASGFPAWRTTRVQPAAVLRLE